MAAGGHCGAVPQRTAELRVTGRKQLRCRTRLHRQQLQPPADAGAEAEAAVEVLAAGGCAGRLAGAGAGAGFTVAAGLAGPAGGEPDGNDRPRQPLHRLGRAWRRA